MKREKPGFKPSVARYLARLTGGRPYSQEVWKPYRFAPDAEAVGLARIAAWLNVSERRLRELRNPSHEAYDPRVAKLVRKRYGRNVAYIGALVTMAGWRAVEIAEVKRAGVNARWSK